MNYMMMWVLLKSTTFDMLHGKFRSNFVLISPGGSDTSFSAVGHTGFSSMSSESKYNGLLKQSIMKKIRNAIFSLLNHIDIVVPPFYPMHDVVSVFRIFQILLPCLYAQYNLIWEPGSLGQKCASIISVLYSILPNEYRNRFSITIEGIYCVLTLIFFVVVVFSAFWYVKKAKISTFVSYYIYIYSSTFFMLLTPIALGLSAETIARLIMKVDSYQPLIVEIVVILLVVIFSLLVVKYFKDVLAISLIFRPMSLMTVSRNPQLFAASAIILLQIVSGIGCKLNSIGMFICLVLMVIIYCGSIYIALMPCSFIKTWHLNIFMSSCATGAVHTVIIIVFMVIGKKASEIIFFELIGLFILFLFLANLINNYKSHKYLAMLECYMENKESYTEIDTINKYLQCACIGMKYAHPACLDWSIFRYAIDNWPTSLKVWTIFGKFVAIYPSEDNVLSFVVCSIVAKRLKGSIAKQTISQAMSIMTSRETALSPHLKTKLTKLSKQVNHTKNKLRHIWDLVIQGNIVEMEQGITNAYNNITKSNVDFAHILSEYPNNRFVSRQYSRFLYEVLGDQKGYMEWSDKTRLLMRGVFVNQDKANVLGIHAFPNLPIVINNNKLSKAEQTESIQSMTDISEFDEDQMQTTVENINFLNTQIEHLNIPSIKLLVISSFLYVLLLITVPIVVVLIIGNSFIEDSTQPLNFMYILSYLRALNFMTPLFAHHWVLENVPSPSSPTFDPPQLDYMPKSLGSTDKSHDQAQYLVGETITMLEALGEYHTFLTSHPILQKAADIVYDSKVCNYDYYLNRFTTLKQTISLTTALSDVVHYTSDFLAQPISNDVFNDTRILTTYTNAHPMSTYASTALEYIEEYVRDFHNKTYKIIFITQISVSVFYAVFLIVTCVIEVIYVESNKQQIYKCLTALPKNVVSQMSESLRIIKKEEGTQTRSTEMNTDISRQEENVIKVLNAESDNTNLNVDKLLVVVCHLTILICALVGFNVTVTLFTKASTGLQESAPQLNNVLGTCGYMAAVFLGLNNIMGMMNGCPIANLTITEVASRAEMRIERINYYFHAAKFGVEDLGLPPYKGIVNTLDERFGCTDEMKITNKVRDWYRCFTPDEQVFLFEPLAAKFLQKMIFINITNQPVLNSRDPLFTEIWVMSLINLYDLFFIPMFENIVRDLTVQMRGSISDVKIPAIIMIVIAFIAEFVIIKVMLYVEVKFKYSLTLLLHCPIAVVMQTPKIMDILSGNFKDNSKDMTNRQAEFYDDLIMSIPDSIIIANQQNQIILINRASERIYNIKSDEVLNTDLRDFLSSSYFKDDTVSILDDNSKQITIRYEKGESTSYLLMSAAVISTNTIVTCRDNTQIVTYNNLIDEEKSKSDKLLASILPSNLVKRVQSGEKNISFAVQSATITFLDIVEFTPWCGSHEATMVMSTLNTLFKELDGILSFYPTMTKIKCIGDCYMAAAGIFSEINQPAVHSREVVDFGLDAIEAVKGINSKLGTELKVRVGINTGGPIVGGVLGTEKPTFEILGTAINMAQQMEHHGVPMVVHISRPVYELVYGGYFIIKERGEIEIKSGHVLTYLVSGRNKK